MKRLFLLIVVLFCLLTGCSCDHDWLDATCEEPRTCYDCGETKGKPAGHDWMDATCEEPKTCLECGETKGNPKAHNWQDATCQQPMTCAECGKSEGEPTAHNWVDATFDTPKTCNSCGTTEGEPLSSAYVGEKLYANGEFLITYDIFAELYRHHVLEDLGLTMEQGNITDTATMYYFYNSRGSRQDFYLMLQFDRDHTLTGISIVEDLDISDDQMELALRAFYGAGNLVNPNLTLTILSDVLNNGEEVEYDGGIAIAGLHQGVCYCISAQDDYGMLSLFLNS